MITPGQGVEFIFPRLITGACPHSFPIMTAFQEMYWADKEQEDDSGDVDIEISVPTFTLERIIPHIPQRDDVHICKPYQHCSHPLHELPQWEIRSVITDAVEYRSVQLTLCIILR